VTPLTTMPVRVSLPHDARYDRLERAAPGTAPCPGAAPSAADEGASQIASSRGHDRDRPGRALTGLRLVADSPSREARAADTSGDELSAAAEPRDEAEAHRATDLPAAGLAPGAEAEFSDLFRSMHTEVRTFVLRRVDLELVDDVVGDTFLAVWHGWEKVPADPSGRRAWVYGVLRNKLLQAAQNAGRRSRLRAKVSSLRPTDHGPVGEAIESLRAARDLLDLLPPAERDAVAFTVLAGLSCAETAEVLECSVSSVTTRVSRARTRLRTILLERETTSDGDEGR
jgi:RNA polymerase sigma-70 factor, ECF subfamily